MRPRAGVAEVDGNRTRRTGSAVPPALKAGEPTRRSDTSGCDRSATGRSSRPRGRAGGAPTLAPMKKLIALAVLALLGWFAWKKVQEG